MRQSLGVTAGALIRNWIMKQNGRVSSKKEKGLVARLRREEMFLNHSFVPWSIVSFNKWLKTNHRWWHINTAGCQVTFFFWTEWKMTFWQEFWFFIFYFFLLLCVSPTYSCQSLKRFQLNCPTEFFTYFPNLSLGLWQSVILFFPDAISNLIEVHLCSPVLWIKMEFFMGRGACSHGWAPFHSNSLYLEGE